MTPGAPHRGERVASRALILDDKDRCLLARHTIAFDHDATSGHVWVAPGGGVEPGESVVDALRRELLEELGAHLRADADPWLVWVEHRTGGFNGWSALRNHYFLVPVRDLTEPLGDMPTRFPMDPGLSEVRWWTPGQIELAAAPTLFSPRRFPMLWPSLLAASRSGRRPSTPLILEG